MESCKWISIAAMSTGMAIGLKDKLPWSIPSELEWFRRMTHGQTIIVGRRTFDSIPVKSMETTYLVLSRNSPDSVRERNVVYVSQIESLKNEDAVKESKEIYVCGGADIYEQLLPECDELFLTIIKEDYEGDRFFPAYEHLFDLSTIIYENDLLSIGHYKKRPEIEGRTYGE